MERVSRNLIELVIIKRSQAPTLGDNPYIQAQKIYKVMLPRQSSQGSLFEYLGRLVLAYRKGWEGAEIHLADLGQSFPSEGFQVFPRRVWGSGIGHKLAPEGREDARLFDFRGRVCVSWSGLKTEDGFLRSRMFVAELDNSLKEARECWCPDYYYGKKVEKNWQFFEYNRQLFCVYSIEPHIILRMDGVLALEMYKTTSNLEWQWGSLRGGCPPVLVGDEFYHFFHGQKIVNSYYTYTCGVYTFENKPPFAVRRFCNVPLMLPVPREGTPRTPKTDVVFPCGALLRDNKWYISYGRADSECQISVFNFSDVDNLLKPTSKTNILSRAQVVNNYHLAK